MGWIQNWFESESDQSKEHEHEWLSVGVVDRDTSMSPAVVLVCSCGAWTTEEFHPDAYVHERAETWQFRPPERGL